MNPDFQQQIARAILIRETEQLFLRLFSEGRLTGTVHTCIGQEFSALGFAGQLDSGDVIFSNHRCHGHYLAFTDDYDGLIAELLGKETGTCGGIGSSQHLWKPSFFSNGIQGGIVPLAAGYALSHQLDKSQSIALVFIGDGTLGEGVVYETFNIASKWNLPILFVCEDNGYAQSTPQNHALAGSITARAEAFGIKTAELSTDQPELLLESSQKLINEIRDSRKPIFAHVSTRRLAPHSKGDDTRSQSEINALTKKDFLSIFEQEHPELYNRYQQQALEQLDSSLKKADSSALLSLDLYFPNTHSLDAEPPSWTIASEPASSGQRVASSLNQALHDQFKKNSNAILIGEDIQSPYGGAFKIAMNLSKDYPERVFSTPISEAALVGISSGLALAGKKPFAEIMFGDFLTLAMDQIINHAARFHQMYNHQTNCPLVIRTPMGGGRGYGPTHSQSLEKLFIGIPNLKVVALNPYLEPSELLDTICEEEGPILLIEHKLDYGRKISLPPIPHYEFHHDNELYPVLRACPTMRQADFTIVTYGGMSTLVAESVIPIFKHLEVLPEILFLTSISPLDHGAILESVSKTRKLLTVEEGTSSAGIGAEIIAKLSEQSNFPFSSRRISALNTAIPSAKHLESEILPNQAHIIAACQQLATT